MASYTLSAGERGAYEKSLSAGSVDTVTFPARRATLEVTQIGGTAPMYVTFDGSTPADKGANCFPVHAGESVQFTPGSSGQAVVKVFCRAAAVYSVNAVA